MHKGTDFRRALTPASPLRRAPIAVVPDTRLGRQTYNELNLTRLLPLHRVSSTAAIIALALFLTAPRALAADRIVIDDLGFKVAVRQNVQRIVSLVPTNSEMVCLLACEKIKGGTRYD